MSDARKALCCGDFNDGRAGVYLEAGCKHIFSFCFRLGTSRIVTIRLNRRKSDCLFCLQPHDLGALHQYKAFRQSYRKVHSRDRQGSIQRRRVEVVYDVTWSLHLVLTAPKEGVIKRVVPYWTLHHLDLKVSCSCAADACHRPLTVNCVFIDQTSINTRWSNGPVYPASTISPCTLPSAAAVYSCAWLALPPGRSTVLLHMQA